MIRTFFVFAIFAFAGVCGAGELPVPASSKVSDLTKGMVWNKWETENFIILSIDFSFGNSLRSSLENFRLDFLNILGARDESLPVKCKVVCVPDPQTLKKFFSLDLPKFEIRKGVDGKVKELVVWSDQERIGMMDQMVASILLHSRPSFLRLGVPALLLGPSRVSEIVLSAKTPSCEVFSSDDPDPQSSLVACLFIRREFGIRLFSSIVSDPETNPVKECGFEKKEFMEEVLKRYHINLKSDLESGRTPDWYLSP